jgi:hypothetical protein
MTRMRRDGIMPVMGEELWPALPLEAWKDTYATLHMWSQMVGKVALATAPPINHGWGIALQVTARGLATRTLTHRGRSFAMEFDFIDHVLWIRTSDGDRRSLKLEPKSVAEFYREFRATLRSMSLPEQMWPMPVETPYLTRFDQDTEHHSYDPVFAQRFWRILVQIDRVLTGARCDFVGKCSPVHFFWGAFDLAVTRFSGRPAPPREGPAFMREAYSHEVISHGFWPGGGSVHEAVFYAYAAPEPAGLKDAIVEPSDAFYDRELGEFLLPYEAVRRAPSPESALLQFVDSTYEQAATLAQWDRSALEHDRRSVRLLREAE